MDIVFATRNPGKAREVAQLLDGRRVLTLDDIGFSDAVDETGDTFRANALLKARAVPFDGIVLADDSGLVIDALDGRPGVRSARFLGDVSYTVKNLHILERLAEVPEGLRSARFVCVMACRFPDGRTVTVEGILEGRIAFQPAGDNGFGYDPIFCPAGSEQTLAQLSLAEKNALSHRFRAVAQLKKFL